GLQDRAGDSLASGFDIFKRDHAPTMSARDGRSTTLSVQGFADFGGELLGIERFRQKKHSRFATVPRGQRFFEISRDKNNFDVGMNSAERIGETAATGLRHDQIGEE